VMRRASSLRVRDFPNSSAGVVGSAVVVMGQLPATGAGVSVAAGTPGFIACAALCTARTMFW
jgi:hypothetical protein